MAQSFVELADQIMFWINQLMDFSLVLFQVVIKAQLTT